VLARLPQFDCDKGLQDAELARATHLRIPIAPLDFFSKGSADRELARSLTRKSSTSLCHGPRQTVVLSRIVPSLAQSFKSHNCIVDPQDTTE
jgi:hypothetical protein